MTSHPHLPSQPTALADLVNADPGSVVSRVLFRADGCTATLFAFAEGEGLTEHTSPHTALLLLLDGAAEVELKRGPADESGLHRLVVGDVLRIPPNVPHALRSDEGFKMLLLLIKEPTPEA